MKLSAAQQKIIDTACKEIDFARTHTAFEWGLKERYQVTKVEESIIVIKHNLYHMTRDEAIEYVTKEAIRYATTYNYYYESEKNAQVLCQANSKTLKKLEELGLIEIIKDGRSCIDTIKILNY